MKKISLILSAAFVLTMSSSLALAVEKKIASNINVSKPAQDKVAETLKIGIVNVEEVLQNYAKVPEVDEKLKKQFEPQQQKLANMHKQIDGEVAQFERDQSVMKENDRKAAQTKIVKEQQDFQKMQIDFQKQVILARNDAMKSIIDEIKSAVSVIAKEQHLSGVFVQEAAIYNDVSLDITDQVIKKLKG